MFRNIDLEQAKDHNSKNVSSVARVLQGSFGIKLLAPVVFGKFLLLDPPFHPTKRPVKSEITWTLLRRAQILRSQDLGVFGILDPKYRGGVEVNFPPLKGVVRVAIIKVW